VTLGRRAAAEALGTAFLLAAVVGSGIMGQRLAGGNVALALLANSLATGFALIALIVAFAPRSGAHFNPAVSVALALRNRMPWREAGAYVPAQFAGALLGVLAAHVMFDLPLLQSFESPRTGTGQWFSELVATFGLVFLILGFDRKTAWLAPFAIGAYIAAAYWFTASTSFANPAVTLARALTATFSGIRLADLPGFLVAQALGTACALLADRALRPADSSEGV
jgi:glycerol uptake facilitator-like aquaporin